MNLKMVLFIAVVPISLFAPIMAHQPFFEDTDIIAGMPWQIKDSSISTALYATLDSSEDVDYYTFNGNKNQSVLLSITIPQIEGQENFTPTMALIGPGLPSFDLPKRIVKPDGAGVYIIPSPVNATPFFEPFTRTSYWTRQEQSVTVPENASYQVAIWDDKGHAGRYVFVMGTREVQGGDPDFVGKMKVYWTPFELETQVQGQRLQAENMADVNATGTRPNKLPSNSAVDDGLSQGSIIYDQERVEEQPYDIWKT